MRTLWKKPVLLLFVALLWILILPTMAQGMVEPAVVVDGQVVVNDTVRISEVVSDGNGFIVIHNADENGNFGEVIGHTPVEPGVNYNVVVNIDTTMATDTLFAMLHTDDNTVGKYEFGTVDGADTPVMADDQLITPTFNVDIVSAKDQFVDNLVTIDSVTVQTDGFVVIHADNGEGAPGDVIGYAPVVAGTSTNVVVELTGEATDVIYPMLHKDTNTIGEYEFGSVEGADAPVSVDGTVATMPIWTVPHMRISDQVILSDGVTDMMLDTLTVKSVLSDGPGFVVLHADNEGKPGEVIGYAPVDDGLTTDLTVQIDGVPTPVVYPMLHVDDNTVGEYEFGTVDGADSPVTVNDKIVVFPVDVASSITYSGTLQDNVVTVEKALIDQDGWLVIHADNGNGGPGEVLGVRRIRKGVNYDISVELDSEMMTDTFYPMLHYDTGEIGTYEFGIVDGADLPVTVYDSIVVGELTPVVID